MVNSGKLYEQLTNKVPYICEVRTTTLSTQDVFIRDDTCRNRPCHLLYVGRIDRTKGLLDMVEALAILVEQGEDVILNLVGGAQKGDTILSHIVMLARERGIVERIKYHGFKPLGVHLFASYKETDMYIIASTGDHEGFPRVIWEAMAHSLPVVATSVGAIPHFVGDVAEIIEPRNPQALAAAIARLIHSPDLRQRRIRAGRARAAEMTLEVQTKKMIEQIETWIARVS
jgi:glycosyltransferase involved in cell wall biosynthesis